MKIRKRKMKQKKTFKTTIDDIYIFDKKIRISYTTKVVTKINHHKYTSLAATGAGIDIKEFLIYWLKTKILHKIDIKF